MEDLEIASHIKHEQDFQKQYGSYCYKYVATKKLEKSSMIRSFKKDNEVKGEGN